MVHTQVTIQNRLDLWSGTGMWIFEMEGMLEGVLEVVRPLSVRMVSPYSPHSSLICLFFPYPHPLSDFFRFQVLNVI